MTKESMTILTLVATLSLARIKHLINPFLVALALCAASTSSAQNTSSVQSISIPGAPSCRNCQVSITRIAVLGGPNDSVFAGVASRPGMDSRGRFYLTALDGYRVLVFDAKGKLDRTFGHRGDGPGEFQRIQAVVVGSGDSVLVREGS